MTISSAFSNEIIAGQWEVIQFFTSHAFPIIEAVL